MITTSGVSVVCPVFCSEQTLEILVNEIRIVLEKLEPYEVILVDDGSTDCSWAEIQRLADSYPQGRVAPKVTWRLTKQIVELNGSTDKGEIVKFIEQMPIADSKFLKKFMDENEPKLDMKKTVTTPSGELLTVNVGFGVDFFRPFFWL